MDDHHPWAGIAVRIKVSGRSYAYSEFHTHKLMPLGEPTLGERALGVAYRTITLTDEEVWVGSVCLRCRLPLRFHPEERKDRAKRRYCRDAKRAVKNGAAGVPM
jgi:hypothetical protein